MPENKHTCNESSCQAEGYPVYDWYHIFAGYWCRKHENKAPGQWPYAQGGTSDGTPLDEDY